MELKASKDVKITGDLGIQFKGFISNIKVSHGYIKTNYRNTQIVDYEGTACGVKIKGDIKETGEITCKRCLHVLNRHPGTLKYKKGETNYKYIIGKVYTFKGEEFNI
jgi:hypothetical protein